MLPETLCILFDLSVKSGGGGAMIISSFDEFGIGGGSGFDLTGDVM